MTLKVCDIHYFEKQPITEAKYRIGFKGGLKVDVCQDHQNYLKGLTGEQAGKKYNELQTKYFTA